MIPTTVLEALQRAGLPAPKPERVDRVGYAAVEVRAIVDHQRRLALSNPEAS